MTTLRVRVPATTANLGSGFDCAGMALGWYDELELEVDGGDGVRVEVTGEGAGRVPRDDSHLVVSSLLRGIAEWGGGRPRGLVLRGHNTIPHSRGLGSSAAAIVAGLALAWALVRGGELDRDELSRLASLAEGHPDNAGAAVHGGAILGWMDGEEVDIIPLRLHAQLRARVWVPSFEVGTSGARAALPGEVSRAAAVAQAVRGALLPVALERRPDLLLRVTDDGLHQPYRAGLMVPSASLVARLRSAGVPAAISGAGPTVIAIGTRDQLRASDDVPAEGFIARDLTVGRGVELF